MEIIRKYYDTYMPPSSVPRLSVSDFSSCGSLTAPKFKTLTTVVLFYTPECRFCQTFAGELKKFSEQSMRLDATAAAIDMSIPENTPLISSSSNFPYNIGSEWPTIIIFYKGHPCASYTSSRTSSALTDFISNNIGVGKSCSFKFVPCD